MPIRSDFNGRRHEQLLCIGATNSGSVETESPAGVLRTIARRASLGGMFAHRLEMRIFHVCVLNARWFALTIVMSSRN